MRIEIPNSVLSQTQKAQIVSRGEQLSRNNLFFEMDVKYAATLARMDNIYGEHFKVYEEPLYIFFDTFPNQGDVRGYDEKGNWVELIPRRNIAIELGGKYASGEIPLGGNVDSIMQELADTYTRIDQIHANIKRIDEEKRRKEEDERPAKEEREKAKRIAEAEELKTKEAQTAKANELAYVEKEKHRQERIAWAAEHGSERLKLGLAQGHSCIKLYETEMGEHLIGDNDYEYDRENVVEEKDRSCPSLEALKEVERIHIYDGMSATVVWLPDGLTEMHKDPEEEYNEPESGCEAVRVNVKGTKGYWYKTF